MNNLPPCKFFPTHFRLESWRCRNNLWSSANLIAVGCQSVTALHVEILKDRALLKIIDILGRETKQTNKQTTLHFSIFMMMER